MNYKGTFPLAGLLIPLFALFLQVIFELTLQLSALLTMSLSLGISFALPTVAAALVLSIALSAALTLALGLQLPSFNIDLSLAFSFELTIVLALLAQLELLLAINATLCAYGWFGPASALGTAVSSTVGEAWPDGTAAEADITAVLLVATAGSASRPDEVEGLQLLVAPPPPPPPSAEPLPPGTPYPPPQAYTTGLATVVIAPPPSGGVQAVASVTVDNSVATGIGAVTAIALVEGGSGYTSPPMIQIVDMVKVVSAAGNVLTLPNPLAVPVGVGFAVAVADTATPPNVVTGVAKVLTSTTVQLYQDADLTIPLTGDFTGSTVKGSGVGAAALAKMGGGSQQGIKTLLAGMRWPNVVGVIDGGVITLQGMMPGVFTALADLKLNLSARAALLGSASISATLLPPSVSASIEFVAKITAKLKANLTAKLPNLGVSLAAALGLQIDAVGKLVAAIGLYLGLAALELEVWEYTGPGSGLGAAISAGPGTSGWREGTPASAPVVVGVLGLTTPASVVAFKLLFPGAK